MSHVLFDWQLLLQTNNEKKSKYKGIYSVLQVIRVR